MKEENNFFFKDRKVLITGGAGVIGKELIQMLEKQEAIIRCVDIFEKPEEFKNSKVDYYRLDLSDPHSQFLFRFQPEFVFHLAADFERSLETEQFWESNFLNNVMASHYTIKEIIKHSSLKKIIFASSYLCYDKKQYHDTSKIKYLTEDSKINPRNLTGIAKMQTEMDLEFLGKIKGFSYVSARIYRVYGLNHREVINRWIRDILTGKEIILFSENNRFDYIFSRDVAEGLLKLGMSNTNGIYNLGSGVPTKISEIIDILKEELGEFIIRRTNETIFEESSCADMSKMQRDLNWKPSISVKQGIKEIIMYEKQRLKDGNDY